MLRILKHTDNGYMEVFDLLVRPECPDPEAKKKAAGKAYRDKRRKYEDRVNATTVAFDDELMMFAVEPRPLPKPVRQRKSAPCPPRRQKSKDD